MWSRRAPAVGTVRDRWSLINRTTTTDRPVLWLLTKLQCRFERWAEGGHTLPPPKMVGPFMLAVSPDVHNAEMQKRRCHTG